MNISNFDNFETEKVEVRVKDLIAFLSKFDPELPVHLDKDGWPIEDDVNDVIRYLIDDSAVSRYRCLMINN